MTAPDTGLDLRPAPAVVALYCLSFGVAVGMVGFVLSQDFPGPFLVVWIVFVLGIVGFNAATILSRVRGQGDGSLQVRNRLSTRVLQRADVDRVMVGRQGGFGSPKRVQLLLQDGSVLPLIATEVPFGRGRLERQAGEIRSWMTGTPTPTPYS